MDAKEVKTVTLRFSRREKNVANTLDEVREFFDDMGGEEVKSAGTDSDVITAVDRESNKSLFFKFKPEKLKKVIKTIMPRADKPEKEPEEEEIEEES